MIEWFADYPSTIDQRKDSIHVPKQCAKNILRHLYLLFVGGIVLFVVVPASHHESWKKVLVHGAVFGLVTYATYDLTNLATIKDWPLIVTVVDLAWGMSVGAIVSLAGFAASRLFS
ncbi:MAG TPA: DUF2177 family protein [Sedimentisphaerales bacterium]|nr:DUF2177 family protein [Sedimentisphaerales bacterium]HRS11172.1 DUF2177 family protein [Sedimentisphaerales bacterium]HRV47750.1 DUF2177 family protein [Sedimentisphaerales bacterium]